MGLTGSIKNHPHGYPRLHFFASKILKSIALFEQKLIKVSRCYHSVTILLTNVQIYFLISNTIYLPMFLLRSYRIELPKRQKIAHKQHFTNSYAEVIISFDLWRMEP